MQILRNAMAILMQCFIAITAAYSETFLECGICYFCPQLFGIF